MTVTAAAGGVTDVLARAIGQRLSEKWGQQILIENRGGGGHILGAAAVAKAAPDGHTLMVAEAGTYVINPECLPQGQAAVRPGQGFDPDHRPGPHPPFAGRKSVTPREFVRRADRTGETEARHAHLRHRRRRVRAAPEHGQARERGRREIRHGPLPGCDPRFDRYHGRAHEHDDDQRGLGARADRFRGREDARNRQPEALAFASRLADRRRDRAGLYRGNLVRIVRRQRERRARS